MNSRFSVRAKRFLGSCVSLLSAFCFAGQASSSFNVQIALNQPGSGSQAGICVSQTLSEQTNALVKVVCSSGQFVSIVPRPGKPFLGLHGGAFRYTYGGGHLPTSPNSNGGFHPGTGTVTALRIYNATGSDGPLEMLVSF